MSLFSLVAGREGSLGEVRSAGAFAEACFCDNSHGHSWVFCRHMRCRQCAAGPESATLHADCVSVFLATSLAANAPNSLSRLWTAATWRSPWPGAPSLHLRSSVDVAAGLGHAAAALELPWLPRLPPEIAAIVHQESRPSLVWRYSQVSQLASTLFGARNFTLPPMSIHRIEYWQRGQLPQTAKVAK